jgi:thiamine-monophosphate kinase
MGAVPAGFLLALTLPGADSRWLERFGQGLSRACDHFAVALIGGDTTRGPLCITVQVNGYVDRGKALCRGGAREGDRVLVSGTLGDAGAALSLLSRADASLSEAEHQLLARYYFPEPRLVLGRALIGHAHAAMDISDGLLADAEHMAGASGVSIELDVGALPLSGALRQCQPDIARQLALTAGDDYELLVSMSEAAWADFQLRPESGLLTPIGRVHTGAGVFLSSGGVPVAAPLKKGYRHFD